jgi:hypothetical protein
LIGKVLYMYCTAFLACSACDLVKYLYSYKSLIVPSNWPSDAWTAL